MVQSVAAPIPPQWNARDGDEPAGSVLTDSGSSAFGHLDTQEIRILTRVSGRGVEQEPRVSLADAGLLVVVFLLVCLTFAIEDGLFLRLPEGEAGRGRASGGCVKVVALGNGGIEVDGKPCVLGEAGAAVRAALASRSGLVVAVEARPGARAAVISDLLGEVGQAGAARISLGRRR